MASGSSSRDSPSLEDDELKGDGKKRKFKPFSAVRNFFGKIKRKPKDEQVNVVAVKAKSTTALHDDNNEDDDGGFKCPPRPLGHRSISEDSVFSPEQRETNLQALKKTAVSEESIPKSAFQAELFSKLNKRRSQYSDDDDGLPHSPTPPVTTADIIMGGPLKPLPSGKSTSRESDKSLISMDGSENEEEDLFKSKWKSSVPSKLSKTEQSGGFEGPIEFDKVSNTELLKSDAARDRINIKPKARKATRKSQIKRGGSSPHLPSLNEESPTKSQTGEEAVSSPKKVVTPQDSVELEISIPADRKEQPQVTLRDKKDSDASQPQIPARLDSASSSQKSKPAPVPADFARPHSAGDDSTKDEVKRSSLKSTVTVSTEGGGASAKRASFAETGGDTGKARVKETSVTPTSDYDNVIMSAAVTAGSEVAKKGNLKDSSHILILSSSSPAKKEQNGSDTGPSSKPQIASSSSWQNIGTAVESSSIKVQAAESVKLPGTEVSSSSSSEKEGESSASARITVSTTASPAIGTEGKKEGLRPTDGQTAAYSPKDDYRLKRQSRSKTLPEQPVSKDENFATKVQRTASHRVEPSSSQNASPEASPRLKFAGTEKGKSAESAPTRSEPEWFALARRKTGRTEEKEDSPAASPTKETAVGKESMSISLTDLAGSASKADSLSAVKSDTVTAVKSDTITAVKSDTVAAVKPDTVTAVKSDTASAVKPDSLAPVSQPSDAAATDVPATSKLEKPAETTTSDGIHKPVRGGSVKTSPTKVTSTFSNRGSSVKVLSTKSNTGSPRKESSATTQPTTVVTQSNTAASSTAAAAAKQETKKEEPKNTETKKEETKSSDTSPAKEVPKWKTQSTKVTLTPAATPISSRFGSVKSVSTTTTSSSTTSSAAAPVTASSAAKVESKPVPASSAAKVESKPVPASSAAKVESKPPTTSAAKVESKLPSPVKTPAVSKSSSVDSAAKEDKAVPAWRANLGGKKPGGLGGQDIKIELIESSSSSSTPASSAATDKKEDASKKQESPSKTSAGNKDMQTDQCRGSASSRSSKVLDLVKNFQNLQVS